MTRRCAPSARTAGQLRARRAPAAGAAAPRPGRAARSCAAAAPSAGWSAALRRRSGGAPRRTCSVERREVHLPQRARRSAAGGARLGWPRAAARRRGLAKWVTRPVHAAAQLAFGQAGGQWVHRAPGRGCGSAGRRRARSPGSRRSSWRPCWIELAAQRDRLAGLDADARDAVAQPDGVDGAGGIPDGGLAAASARAAGFRPRGVRACRRPSLRPGRTGRRSARRAGTPGGATGSGRAGRDGADAEARIQPRADGADALECLNGRAEGDTAAADSTRGGGVRRRQAAAAAALRVVGCAGASAGARRSPRVMVLLARCRDSKRVAWLSRCRALRWRQRCRSRAAGPTALDLGSSASGEASPRSQPVRRSPRGRGSRRAPRRERCARRVSSSSAGKEDAHADHARAAVRADHRPELAAVDGQVGVVRLQLTLDFGGVGRPRRRRPRPAARAGPARRPARPAAATRRSSSARARPAPPRRRACSGSA